VTYIPYESWVPTHLVDLSCLQQVGEAGVAQLRRRGGRKKKRRKKEEEGGRRSRARV
jgi:hypothetical protein